MLREGESEEAIKLFHEKACLLCKVFGSLSFTGHVEFSDAYPIGEDGSVLDVPVGVRTGIAINRRTGAVYRVRSTRSSTWSREPASGSPSGLRTCRTTGSASSRGS
jgi:hypothetical protein